MEKEKYYTPSIEEFHVGFEYETKYACGPWYNKKVEFEIRSLSFYISHFELKGNDFHKFRVKYLDSSDIESFGFTFEADYTTKLHFQKQVIHRGDEAIINIYYNCLNRWIMISLKRGDQFNTIFCGFIKNKSELSRLLKQLSII